MVVIYKILCIDLEVELDDTPVNILLIKTWIDGKIWSKFKIVFVLIIFKFKYLIILVMWAYDVIMRLDMVICHFPKKAGFTIHYNFKFQLFHE